MSSDQIEKYNTEKVSVKNDCILFHPDITIHFSSEPKTDTMGTLNKSSPKGVLKNTRPRTLRPKNIYLKVRAEVDNLRQQIDRSVIQDAIERSLNSLYGVVGSQTILYQTIGFSKNDNSMVLRVNVDHHQKLWAAITIVTRLQNQPGRLIVTKATPFIFALFDETMEGF